MSKLYTVYKTTNIINSRVYYGAHITDDINDDYLGSGKYLINALNKYGRCSFHKEIIFNAVSKDIMFWIERMIVDEECVIDTDTYNLKVGGDGGFSYINSSGLNGRQFQPDEAWNKGLNTGPNSEESNIKRSDTLRDRYRNQEHHSKGRTPWNKGLKKCQEAWNKGLLAETKPCPYCNKEVNAGNFSRWHGDNCKFKN